MPSATIVRPTVPCDQDDSDVSVVFKIVLPVVRNTALLRNIGSVHLDEHGGKLTATAK